MYDPEAQMYTVVAENKSEENADKGGGLEQNVEQMLGLFVDRQTLMLGLVVQNLNVRPLLLQLADGVLTFTLHGSYSKDLASFPGLLKCLGTRPTKTVMSIVVQANSL